MGINILVYLVFTVGGLIFMKLGAGNTNIQYSKSVLNISLNINIIIGLIAYMISFIMYTILLKKYELSYIIPITTSLSYIAVLISGALIFRERITIIHGIAVVLILIGVIILNVYK